MNPIRPFLLILLSCCCIVQVDGQDDFFKQQTRFIALNVGFNGLVGGVGSLINKREGQKGGQAFWRGFKHGAIGGGVIVLGKQATYRIFDEQKLGYGWVAKLTTSIGSSIVQNASANRAFWERWHLNLPFVRSEYDFKNKHFKVRIMPTHLATYFLLGKQAKVNWSKSLRVGALYYEKQGRIDFRDGLASGLAVYNGFGLDTTIGNDRTFGVVAHEMVHLLQYDSHSWANSFFIALDEKWKAKSKLYKGLSKVFYFDFNASVGWMNSELWKGKPWECRPMEREADHFSRKRIWPGCL